MIRCVPKLIRYLKRVINPPFVESQPKLFVGTRRINMNKNVRNMLQIHLWLYGPILRFIGTFGRHSPRERASLPADDESF
jgi:hypothetical protein